MKLPYYLYIFIVLFTACQGDYNDTTSADQLVPSTAQSVLIIRNLNDFYSSIKNQDILSEVYRNQLKSAAAPLKHINTDKPIYLAFLDDTNLNYVLIAEQHAASMQIDSSQDYTAEKIKNTATYKISNDSLLYYKKHKGKFLTVSNNLEVLNNLKLNKKNTTLSNLIKTTDASTLLSAVFTSNANPYSKLLLAENNLGQDHLSVIDMQYTDEAIRYNGVSKSIDTARTALNCLKNTIAQKINTPQVIPSETKSLFAISYDNYTTLNYNLSKYSNIAIDSTQTFLNFTNEIAISDNILIAHTLDIDLALDAIEQKTRHETFRGITIYTYARPDFFKTRLAPLLRYDNAQYFCNSGDFLIFSQSVKDLKSVISANVNRKTLANTNAFITMNTKLSDEASIFIFKNSDALGDILDTKVKGYDANAVQYIYDNNYAHINGVIQKHQRKAARNSVSESFTLALDKALIAPPQTVKNHITKAHDIVIQDINNVLYLISSSGKILWEKELHGPVLGTIKQIDTYKNGRLQLAFTTPNRLYVLDRNGNDVSSFPLKFKDNITQPLSVFDYDNRRNYRLLVTQDKALSMFDSKGRTVKGFDYKNTNNNIINTQPKHYRINSKDYIAFMAGDYLKILNRQGNIRIEVTSKIPYAGNDVYCYQNKFTTTNTLGQLVQVDTNGQLNTKNLNLTNTHKIETTSKTLVSLVDNILHIKSRNITLDYGDYTAPKIFYLNDKIYVSTTDLQSKKVYLFDSQAKSIPNFPVFGTSAAILQDLDNDPGLELITQADDMSVITYKLH